MRLTVRQLRQVIREALVESGVNENVLLENKLATVAKKIVKQLLNKFFAKDFKETYDFDDRKSPMFAKKSPEERMWAMGTNYIVDIEVDVFGKNLPVRLLVKGLQSKLFPLEKIMKGGHVGVIYETGDPYLTLNLYVNKKSVFDPKNRSRFYDELLELAQHEIQHAKDFLFNDGEKEQNQWNKKQEKKHPDKVIDGHARANPEAGLWAYWLNPLEIRAMVGDLMASAKRKRTTFGKLLKQRVEMCYDEAVSTLAKSRAFPRTEEEAQLVAKKIAGKFKKEMLSSALKRFPAYSKEIHDE